MSKNDATQDLKDIVDKNDKALAIRNVGPGTTPNDKQAKNDDTKNLQAVVKTIPNKEIQQQKLHKRAQAADASTEEADWEAILEAEVVPEEEEKPGFNPRKQSPQEIRRNVRMLTHITDTASDAINPAINRVASAKTPGGIGALVLILVILLFIVVQVNANGDTRLKMLWYMLSGQASLKDRQSVVSGDTQHQGGNGGNGNGPQFGDTPTSPSSPTSPTPPTYLGGGLPAPTFGDPAGGIGSPTRFVPLSDLGF